jgi:hypothetical protein
MATFLFKGLCPFALGFATPQETVAGGFDWLTRKITPQDPHTRALLQRVATKCQVLLLQ